MENLKTQNPEWGFYGTIKTATQCDDLTATKIWDTMREKIKSLYPQKSYADIIRFLDNRIGRHLADEIGVNQGQCDPNKILTAIENMSKKDMDSWWAYYYQRG